MTQRKFVDYDNEAYIWEKTKNKFVAKETGKGLSEANFTQTEKAKLENIESGAEANVNADWNASTGDAAILNKPANLVQDASYVHTDNNYTTTEKTKLSGIDTGAEVNQNAFSNVKVGTSTVAADAKTDTLEIAAGSNVTITADTTNDKVTIAATDTTYSDVTAGGVSGLMTGSDKTKLNGIATGAEVNQNAFGKVKVGESTVEADAKVDTLEFVAGSNVTITPDATNDKVTIAATDTTYSAATTSAAGLMSSTDKTKLNGIDTGAEVNQNAFSNVKVGSTTVAADAKTDTLEIAAGTNITVAGDATNDKVTISAQVDTTMSDSSTKPIANSTVKSYIDSAIGSITGISFEIVTDLPASGSAGIIYLKSNSGSSPNSYDEYIWITVSGTGRFEKIGTTDVDLSGYQLVADLVPLTTAEIDAICV